jgi:putative FmdB family regulatory protein
MPTYEFKCKKCSHQFEVFTSIKERNKTRCPKCKSMQVIQLLTGFYMKGGKGSSSCNTCKATTCNTCSLK